MSCTNHEPISHVASLSHLRGAALSYLYRKARVNFNRYDRSRFFFFKGGWGPPLLQPQLQYGGGVIKGWSYLYSAALHQATGHSLSQINSKHAKRLKKKPPVWRQTPKTTSVLQLWLLCACWQAAGAARPQSPLHNMRNAEPLGV